jgi:hypothetical protein
MSEACIPQKVAKTRLSPWWLRLLIFLFCVGFLRVCLVKFPNLATSDPRKSSEKVVDEKQVNNTTSASVTTPPSDHSEVVGENNATSNETEDAPVQESALPTGDTSEAVDATSNVTEDATAQESSLPMENTSEAVDVVEEPAVIPDESRSQKLPDFVLDPTLPDFPYNLSCPWSSSGGSLSKNVSVTLSYHVGMIGNWEDVVRDQMTSVAACGLGSLIEFFIVTFWSSDEVLTDEARTTLLEYFKKLPFSSHHPPDVLRVTVDVPYEGLAMNLTLDHCRDGEQSRYEALDGMKSNNSEALRRRSRPSVVFYMHTKGVWKYDPNWRALIAKRGPSRWTYGQILFWRKYMEYFTIERPQLCLRRLLPTIPTENQSLPRPEGGGVHCGVQYRTDMTHHYSGNFWAATCDYISRKLSPIVSNEYLAAEMWIGSGSTDEPVSPLAKYTGPHVLYQQFMLPELYGFTPEEEENDYVDTKFPILF